MPSVMVRAPFVIRLWAVASVQDYATAVPGAVGCPAEGFPDREPTARPRRPPPRHRHQALHHPIVGDLVLLFEGTELMADPGWNLLINTAKPGSTTADALRLLAAWTATREHEAATAVADSTTTDA